MGVWGGGDVSSQSSHLTCSRTVGDQSSVTIWSSAHVEHHLKRQMSSLQSKVPKETMLSPPYTTEESCSVSDSRMRTGGQASYMSELNSSDNLLSTFAI